jgi:hypothetical protein
MTRKDLDICKQAGERARASQRLHQALRRSKRIEKLLLAVVILTVAALPTTIVTSEKSDDGNNQPVATAQLVRLAATRASR